MPQMIKLMADYDCWPLWHAGGDRVGNIDPETLPLAALTLERLAGWQSFFDGKLNRDAPQDSPPWREEEELWFEEEGRALWMQLGRELGSDYRVHYYSTLTRELLAPLDEGG